MEMKNSTRTKVWLAAACVCVVGCSTIRNARNAQDEYASLGRDDRPAEAAQPPELHGFTLAQLVDFAITNRPSVAQRSLELEDARLALRQLAADAPLISSTPWLSPKISVSGDYSASSARTAFEDLSWRTQDSVGAGITMSIPIYDFGRHDARIRAQEESVLESELQLIDEGFTVFDEVVGGYFSLLEKCALLSVAQTNEQEFAMHLEQVEKRMDAGEAKQLDLSRARLDLAQAKEAVVSAQAEVETADAELQRALGIDASCGNCREIVGYPERPLAYLQRGFPDTDFPVSEAFDFARTNAPSMRICRARLRAASADVDYAVADLMPDVSASVSLNWTDPLWYWHWGVSAVQSVFQGFRKTTSVDRAVNAMRRSAKAVEDGELELSLALEKAIAARDTAQKAQETAEASLKESRDNLELVRQQYEIGDVTRIEYAEAVSAFAQALGNRVSAFYRRQRAECALFPLVGLYPVYQEEKLMEEMK